ncbi:MAG: PAS domain S-box protein [Halobacteriales archaeon]|nr:PAS domain S-box protein [Halobacteriales archaeon]
MPDAPSPPDAPPRPQFPWARLLAGSAFILALIYIPTQLALAWIQENLPGWAMQVIYTSRGFVATILALAFVISVMRKELLANQHRLDLVTEAEERIRSMVENVQDYAIFTIDPEGKVTSWNAGARRIFGYAREEVLGEHFSRFFLPEDVHARKPERELRDVREAGRIEDESWRVRKDGTQFWANTVVTALRDAKGDLRGFTKVTRDLTERRRAEEQRVASMEALKELERLKEIDRFKTQFINMAAHELNTPLTPIKLQVDLLRQGTGELTPQQQKSLDILDRNIQRLTQLVQDVLEVARLQAGRLGIDRRPMDLNRIVLEAAESFQEPARQAGVALQTHLNPDLRLEGDAKRLTQVMFNLLSNAIKFTPRGGQVIVETARVRGGALVRVRDTGIGLRAADMPKLFQPFSQVHDPMQRTKPGTGLGLYISKGLVELHAGRIWAESGGVNQGATVSFIVPIEAGERAVPETIVPVQPARSAETVADRAKELI